MRLLRTPLYALLLASTLSPVWAQGDSKQDPPLPSQPPTEPPGPAEGPAPPPGPVAPPPPAAGTEPILATLPDLPLDLLTDTSAWQLWWWHHRGSWLDLDRAALELHPRTGNAAPAHPRGIAPEAIHGELARALRAVLETEADPALLLQALLALGRIGEEPGSEEPVADGALTRADLLASFLSRPNRQLAEAAVVALGLSGSLEGTSHLASIARDDARGRELLGKKRVDARIRSLACYSLALAARRSDRPELVRFAAHHLSRVLAEEHHEDDLEAAAVLGLGLLPTSSRALDVRAPIEELLAILRNPRASRAQRTHTPTALARLCEEVPEHEEAAAGFDALRDRVVRELLDRIGPRSREDDSVRMSAVLALGLLGDADEDALDREMREALANTMRRGEALERRFASIALAQIAGRPGEGAAPFAASREVERLLASRLTRGKSRERAWAGLSLGLLGRSLRGNGKLVERSTADALLGSVRGARAPGDSAAYALASAMIGDRRASEHIDERFDRVGDEVSRSQISLAMGILGDGGAQDRLVGEMDGSRFDPRRFEWAAVGRAMLGDPTLVPELLDRLGAAASASEIEGCARALAWVGGASGLAPLLGVLRDPDVPSAGRAAAARALGWLGDAEERPWDDPLAPGINYASAPATLTNPGGTGILDLL